MKKTITTGRLREEDFRIKARSAQNRVRVIEIANPTITKELIATLGATSGYLEKDLASDIVPIAIIHRSDKKKMGKGFVRGTNIKEGAFATTVVWDTCNILVVGSSERDMMIATNRLIAIQGGVVVVKNGKVIYEFPMPVYGTIPPYSMEEVKDKTKQLDESVKEIGSTIDRPFLTLQTIPFTGLPFLRITDRGIADIKTKKMVPIFLD